MFPFRAFLPHMVFHFSSSLHFSLVLSLVCLAFLPTQTRSVALLAPQGHSISEETAAAGAPFPSLRLGGASTEPESAQPLTFQSLRSLILSKPRSQSVPAKPNLEEKAPEHNHNDDMLFHRFLAQSAAG